MSGAEGNTRVFRISLFLKEVITTPSSLKGRRLLLLVQQVEFEINLKHQQTLVILTTKQVRRAIIIKLSYSPGDTQLDPEAVNEVIRQFQIHQEWEVTKELQEEYKRIRNQSSKIEKPETWSWEEFSELIPQVFRAGKSTPTLKQVSIDTHMEEVNFYGTIDEYIDYLNNLTKAHHTRLKDLY